MKLYVLPLLLPTAFADQLRGHGRDLQILPLQYLGADPGIVLGRCQGDCDHDDNSCAPGLMCFLRNDDEPNVPGCSGTPERYADYCINPAHAVLGDLFPLQYREKDPNFLLGPCQGDCDDTSDCIKGLVCLQRANDEIVIPGCIGTPVDMVDYCIDPFYILPDPGSPDPVVPLPDPSTQLQYLGNDSAPKPLGVCQGDCDKDADCRPGLRCFFRLNNEPVVPGCSGTPVQYADYCYRP